MGMGDRMSQEKELAERVHRGLADQEEWKNYVTLLEAKIDAMKTALEKGADLLTSAVTSFTDIESCEVIYGAVSDTTTLISYHQDYHDAEDMGVGDYVVKKFYAVPFEKVSKNGTK